MMVASRSYCYSSIASSSRRQMAASIHVKYHAGRRDPERILGIICGTVHNPARGIPTQRMRVCAPRSRCSTRDAVRVIRHVYAIHEPPDDDVVGYV